MSSLLEIRDLKVNYGGIEALKGVSFDVKEIGTLMFGGYGGAVHSSAPKRLATSSALRTPSSWKPLYQ